MTTTAPRPPSSLRPPPAAATRPPPPLPTPIKHFDIFPLDIAGCSGNLIRLATSEATQNARTRSDLTNASAKRIQPVQQLYNTHELLVGP